MASEHPHFVPGPRALAMEDLDAMAASAHLRGEVRAQERMMEAHRIELQAARREAWEEGRAQGEHDGRLAMLAAIGEQVIPNVDQRHAAAAELLRKVGLNPKTVSKAEMEKALIVLVDTLACVITAYHDGFAPAPF